MNEQRGPSTTSPDTVTHAGAVETPGPDVPTCTAHPDDGTVAFPSRQLPRPELPGYEVTEILGRGGMGVVYRANCQKLGRVVAIKTVLGGALAGEAALERFWREARAMAALTHPHIVTLFDVSQHGDSLYMAMEFCPGGTLAQRIANGPLEPSAAAELVESLARAVHAAHQAGIVHRDLKPHNVLFTADGTPKLTDFGLAKKLDGEGITKSDVIMGTPGFMSPEQASGQSKQVGPPADVYGLGAILYAALCGRPPFEGESQLATVVQVLTQDPPPPASIRPDVPKGLDAICLKCLAKKPEERYGSALDLASNLQRFRRGETITEVVAAPGTKPPALPATEIMTQSAPTQTAAAPARRMRNLLVFGGLGVLVLAIVVFAIILWPRKPDPDRVYQEVIDAGMALADAIDHAVPADELKAAKDRYNKAGAKWKDLDLPWTERKSVEMRHENDTAIMARRLASAFQGKGQLDEFRKMMQAAGEGMGDMMKGFFGNIMGKDGPQGFPFPPNLFPKIVGDQNSPNH